MQAFNARFTLIATLCGLCFLSACSKPEANPAAAAQALPVTVMTVSAQSVELTRELPARVSANQIAEIRPQVSGIIQHKFFSEGSTVKAGDTLYQIDAAPFSAAKKSAQAAIAKAKAQLASSQAKAKRYAQLLAIKAVSQQDYDEANAAALQATADLLAAEAQLQTAEINLNYSKVLAPISGKIGQSNVTVGALVSANQSQVLTTITQLEPIYVDLTQASAELLKIKQQQAKGQLSNSANSAKVKLQLEDGSQYAEVGELKFAEVTVDAATGSVKLRAEFANPAQLLLPGMYVKAQLIEGVAADAILVPQPAVSRNHKGEATVFVVNAKQQAELRVLQTERSVDGNWLVTSGLKAGEQIIIEGLQKVRPGALVAATTPNKAEPTKTAPQAKVAGDGTAQQATQE